MTAPEPLTFKVAPHIVQDLGLNLYTDLPRVLVEFIANAYDADSAYARVSLDKDTIEQARRAVKATWQREREDADGEAQAGRLAERTLPDEIQIVIEDAGHGMSRGDLQNRFLVTGLRRRGPNNENLRSPGGRVLMGRKGIGKLAGFGVAQVVTVLTQAAGEAHATEITLDYRELIVVQDTNEIPIGERSLDAGGDFPEGHGTKVILSRLLYEPMKSRLGTIEHRAADHFADIDPEDFRIELNGEVVEPTPRTHVYAWPDPTLPPGEFVDHTYTADSGETFAFQYRLRFVEDRSALMARDRGVRVYAHKRLAAAPDLLAADTNMHGFRMTDYLDGVVYADFIDDQPEDYTATDRQTLRWDSPVLAPMYEFLSTQIKEACKERQKVRDAEKEKEVQEDDFTKAEIEGADLSKREQRAAYRIASAISSLHKKGLEDDGYRARFSQVIRALGQGQVMAALSSLAAEDRPDLDRVVAEVTSLTAEELDGFYRYVKARLNGIGALEKIVRAVDFKDAQNEKKIQEMFEGSPWLVDPTYSQFLSADKPLGTVYERLAKELKIGPFAPPDSEKTEERPDLVSFIHSMSLDRLVIIELKSANLPLEAKHVEQLEYYMERAEKWLTARSHQHVQVHGHLIGTLPSDMSTAKGAVVLGRRMVKAGPTCPWRVRDFLRVLEETAAAHTELLELRDAGKDPDTAAGSAD
ncbi:MAG TPA: ATP-binding protein [Phycisphaerae bacterium]|nr:ATP-binding protein [Phycisphaerae bacterium]HUU90048.1 ATP-binding protein [Phycisphaerae bacterium]